jgi:tRNA (guanine-N(7)-)-methyltransferase
MSSKDKLRKFRENEGFKCLYQPATEEVLGKDYHLKGKWNKEVFKNNNPITIELGCGKGEYTISLAKMFPDRNFIGIDIKGARLWKGAKQATEEKMANVAFIRTRIEFIESIFSQNEISQIWITFADPQIKRERKRLTNPMFLERYKKFLSPCGIINLKTDSQFLHQYTKECAKVNNLEILEANSDIYNSGRADEILSIKTFYETYYIKKGLPISYIAFKINSSLPLISPEWDEKYWEEEEYKSHGIVLANKG